jgi:hypothetical protein
MDSFHCFFEIGVDSSEEDDGDKRSAEKVEDLFVEINPTIVHRHNRLFVNNFLLESNFVKTRSEDTCDIDFDDFGIDVQVLP